MPRKNSTLVLAWEFDTSTHESYATGLGQQRVSFSLTGSRRYGAGRAHKIRRQGNLPPLPRTSPHDVRAISLCQSFQMISEYPQHPRKNRGSESPATGFDRLPTNLKSPLRGPWTLQSGAQANDHLHSRPANSAPKPSRLVPGPRPQGQSISEASAF